MKKLLSLFTAVVLITTATPSFTAVDIVQGDEIAGSEPLAESTELDPAEPDSTEAEIALGEIQPYAATTRVAYSDSNIIGGSIYYNPDTGAIVDCDTNVVSCVIPSEIDGVAITSINSNAFRETSIMKVTMPDSITKIGEYAFFKSDLRDVVVPESVTTIEECAFEMCDTLKTVKILGAASLENYTFYDDPVLEEVDISNVISLGTHTFGLCDALYKVNYPQKLDVIPDYTFYSCNSLKDFVISENVKRIGASAFDHAGLAGNFEIPSNVIEIGNTAFSANDIVTLTINANIKVIPQSAFSWNADLVSVKIGEGIVGVENHAFYMNSGCSLETVSLPSTLEYIVQEAFYCGRVKVQNLYFAGCETKWQNVLIASGNESLTSEATMHFADHHNEYKYDDTDHWLVCEFCGTVSSDRQPHSLDESGQCPTCGYGATVPHIHNYTYRSDVHVHWQYCEECGQTCNVEEHAFEGNICSECYCEETKPTLSGDMNSDGKITLEDAIAVLKMAMGIK